jgi:hypothetical protein
MQALPSALNCLYDFVWSEVIPGVLAGAIEPKPDYTSRTHDVGSQALQNGRKM